jgi:[protein-PII] uridylyltransferase
VKDCLRLGRDDYTIRTALLERRLIAGDRRWPTSSASGSGATSSGHRPRPYRGQAGERAERHRRQGGQRYVLEPNVKEGKGGLRDLQTLFWIAKYVNRVRTRRPGARSRRLHARGVPHFAGPRLPDGGALPPAPDLGPRVDQLTFDIQVEVAERMGYRDRGGRARSSTSCRPTSAMRRGWASSRASS